MGLLLIAAQATLFEGVILQSAGDIAHAKAPVSASSVQLQQGQSGAECREETITLDEGYGLRGQETQEICEH